MCFFFFFFSSRRRHTRYWRDWSSDVCSSDLSIILRADRRMIERRHHVPCGERSEERRVGKECRSRGAADQEKKKRIAKHAEAFRPLEAEYASRQEDQ